MKILHTADWHLGKIVNEFSMLEDQEYVLNQLVDQVKDLGAEVVIMAGDLYDRAIPPKEAVTLATNVFTRLIREAGIPVLVIAGNHDSNERIEYGSELLASSNLYIEGMVKETVRKVTIKNVNYYLLPFGDHVTIRQVLQDDSIKDLQDALKVQVESIKEEMNVEEINILIAHGYVVNGGKGSIEESESERPLSIGTAEYVEAELFDDFDYVALGHLHKAQRVKNEKVRYSGSPLKYSKSEVRHKKQHLLVGLMKEGVSVESVDIKPIRDMKVLQGSFEELMQGESEDYIFFELEDTHYVMDAMNQLRRRYPYAMGLEYISQKDEKKMDKLERQKAIETKSLLELFDEFYGEYKQMPLDEKRKSTVSKVWEAVQREEDR